MQARKARRFREGQTGPSGGRAALLGFWLVSDGMIRHFLKAIANQNVCFAFSDRTADPYFDKVIWRSAGDADPDPKAVKPANRFD